MQDLSLEGDGIEDGALDETDPGAMITESAGGTRAEVVDDVHSRTGMQQ